MESHSDRLIETIARLAAAKQQDPRAEAEEVASLIRTHGAHRWVGVYQVGVDEIFVLGWSGPDPPVHPTFPRDAGLCGRAAASRAIVSVDDVTKDSDHLTTLTSTRSEIVVPVLNNSMQPIGLIDVKSERVAA